MKDFTLMAAIIGGIIFADLSAVYAVGWGKPAGFLAAATLNVAIGCCALVVMIVRAVRGGWR
jgi:hypothetical protein